ncbi:MAG: putative nuclease-like protein [Prokaryotic dsDNA virus sp.]|jgi:micrococcal nuclease|nr:MAG: putative nuclease-like protein [Prokaryotic dsDNA virus sp.]QDP67326.1 MAG: putative nuclease-like protein [Prokaryotic dsDNA virus sp.]|tara:strand:- start:300 stop:659 length:360 start_codon:yes stop_codon:yes gene_type:complete
MYEYRCVLRRVVDGDTIDVDIDLGFKVWLRKERVRLYGINTPESRTRNLDEKKLGLLAKARLKELLQKNFTIRTEKDGKGKFGRILGVPYVEGHNICEQLIEEGHARSYFGYGPKEPWT